MTTAPQTLIDLGRYWTSQGGRNLGIVGDTAHQSRPSYHNGQDVITAHGRTPETDYTIRLARDREPYLTNAASAIDLGKLNGSLTELQAFSRWLVARAMADERVRHDIREIIYSPDGRNVKRYDAIYNVIRNEGDASHLGHTHISFLRDSEKRDKVWLFSPYFVEDDMITLYSTGGKMRTYPIGTPVFDAPDGAQVGKVGSADTVYRLAAQDAAEDENVKWYLIDGGGDEKRMGWVKA